MYKCILVVYLYVKIFGDNFICSLKIVILKKMCMFENVYMCISVI